MFAAEFHRLLEKGAPLAPVYLFSGDADLLMEEAWKRLMDVVLPGKAGRFNGERLLAAEVTASDVAERAETRSMFGSRRLLMVQRIEQWPKEEKAAILEYLARPSPAACLVLTATHKKGLEKIEAAVEAVGAVVRFTAPGEKDLPGLLMQRAAAAGKKLSPPAARFLLEQLGPDLRALNAELEKVVVYVGDRDRIEVEDIHDAVGAHRTFTVFELTEFVAQNQPLRAVGCLRELLASGAEPLPLLGLLARQIRITWQIKDAVLRGLDQGETARRIGLPPFVVKKASGQAALFSEDDLARAHREICRTDIALKSSGAPPELLLESLVVGLCRRSPAPKSVRRH